MAVFAIAAALLLAQPGHAVLPLVFPDGTRAELVYPPSLDIAGLDVAPYGSATLHGKSPDPERSDFVARDFRIHHGDVREHLDDGVLLARYRGADGRPVGFWDLPRPEPNYLAFQFGSWAVLVYDYPAGGAAMTHAERAAWAASFSGRESPGGYLVLEGTGPLRLARAGEHAGPSLMFGSPGGPRFLQLIPAPCSQQRVSRSRGFASWCLSGSMRAHTRGRGPVIEAMIRGLRVRAPSRARIDLRGHPGEIVAAREGVWVIVHRPGRRTAVARIDTAANRVAATVPVAGDMYRIAAGEGAVWVAGSLNRARDVLHRIDPETGRVAATLTFPRSYVGRVAAGEGAVWLALTDRETRAGSLAQIDPGTNEVVTTTPLTRRHALDEVAVGQGAVWVLALRGLDGPGHLIRVDPQTGRVTDRIWAKALNMGVGPGGVWMTGCVDCAGYRDTYFAQEIDPRAGEPVGRRIVVQDVGFGPLHVGKRSVWFSGYENRGSQTVVFRLDRRRRAVERLRRVGDFLHTGMAFDAKLGVIWVARAVPPSVLRVSLPW